jgi:myo-inositol-1(or 4)-monophosphatase
MSYQPFITSCLQQASSIANNHFEKVIGTVKAGDSNQVLTQADLEIGNFVIKQIEENFPDHNIIDEEAGVVDKNSSFTWVVDPIDGTSNFAQGIPTYGVMIGLLEKDSAIAGGIALPAFEEIYFAEKGSGAWCNGQKISVTDESKLIKMLVAYGIDGHQEDREITQKECQLLANIILNIRNLRTSNSAFDTAMVARGKYGAVLNRTSKIWDNVAQQIIIEEAGGIYTDFWGKSIDYSNPLTNVNQNYTLCAAPQQLHTQLQDIIHKEGVS